MLIYLPFSEPVFKRPKDITVRPSLQAYHTCTAHSLWHSNTRSFSNCCNCTIIEVPTCIVWTSPASSQVGIFRRKTGKNKQKRGETMRNYCTLDMVGQTFKPRVSKWYRHDPCWRTSSSTRFWKLRFPSTGWAEKESWWVALQPNALRTHLYKKACLVSDQNMFSGQDFPLIRHWRCQASIELFARLCVGCVYCISRLIYYYTLYVYIYIFIYTYYLRYIDFDHRANVVAKAKPTEHVSAPPTHFLFAVRE